jgi:hypothetical protein
MGEVTTFTVADIAAVLAMAVEAGFITESQAAQIAGLFIAQVMLR